MGPTTSAVIVPAQSSTASTSWCAECSAAAYRNWVHLRVCLMCGHVGCCNSSPGKHASAHANQHAHALVRSYEPGEDWFYCYVEDVAFLVDGAPAAPSHQNH